jgi:hypothetical protein
VDVPNWNATKNRCSDGGDRCKRRLIVLYVIIYRRSLACGLGSLCAPVPWQNTVVFPRLTDRKEWKFFAVLPKADPGLAAAWWTVLLL